MRQVDTWDEMKSPMRRRFVSNHYYRELYKKLQSLNQSTKSVDEYFKKIEQAMIRANIKDIEAIVTRFINDLNRDTTHIVELHHYVKLEMVHMTMKVEKQLKQKGTI